MIGKRPDDFVYVQENLGTSIGTALWSKAKQCMEYINASRPVGSLMFFYISQQSTLVNPAGQNVSAPDSAVWQFCDGSMVSNPLSPIYGVTLPDCRQKLFAQTVDGVPTGTIQGSDTVNLDHDHGGLTGTTNDQGANNGDFELQVPLKPRPYPHQHPISSDLGVTSVIPVYNEVQVYIRIV